MGKSKKRSGVLRYLQTIKESSRSDVFALSRESARNVLRLIDERDRKIARLQEHAKYLEEELEHAARREDDLRYGELRE